ncbi:MAG: hypothetical protein A4E74_02307 [Syntrophus sp. PtaB.Bin075]|nr:MAG: hypothetical protein A4E74_02307 [Syntrophus sp. PtaB.Bin075]
MGRAILAQADAVVGKDIDDTKAHEGGKPNGRPHVIGEGQKGGRIGKNAPMKGHPHGNGPHGMFPDAVMDVAAFIAPRSTDTTLHAFRRESRRLKIAQPFEPGEGGRIEIRRSAHQFRDLRGKGLHHRFPGLAGGHIGGSFPVHGQCRFPVVGQPTGQNPAEFRSLHRILPAIAFKCLKPLLFPGFPPIERLPVKI